MDAVRANEPTDVETATARVLERIKADPAYRVHLHRLLAFCLEPRSAAQIRDKMLSFPEMRSALHSPQALLAWLTEAGGIAALPDGKETRWQTTEAGRRVTEQYGPAARLLQLMAGRPHYGDIYKRVLTFCQTPRAMAEIDQLLKDDPGMENPKVYPSFFVDGLEAAGGLEWDGKWRASDAAKPFIA